MENRDLHKQSSQLKSAIDTLERSELAPENKQLVKSFVRDLQVDGVRALKQTRYIQTLRLCAERWCPKPFSEWTTDDLKDVLLAIGNAGFKTSTVNEYRAGLRRFFSWHYGDNNPFHKLLKGSRREHRLPQTIDEETVFKLIDTAKSPQDKALIATLYDGGFRVGELAGLTWQDIQFNEHGA
ncbi:MAG: tyrosine-type recombinase/integrase, partial [Methermicoccaceae archaeon]